MRFTLDDMVRASLLGAESTAMEKIAEEAGGGKKCEACGKDIPAESKFCQECASKKSRDEGTEGLPEQGAEKTSAARVEKLAEAVDAVRDAIATGAIDYSRVKIGEGAPTEAKGVGPDQGPNTTTTNDATPTGGEQSTVSGEAKTKIPMRPKMTQGSTPKAAPNAMDDNIEMMHPEQPAAGVMKQGGVRAFYERVMLKAAEDSVPGAPGSNIEAPKSTTLPEDQPSQMKRPPEVTSQERMVATNQAAIDADKRQAKEVPKKRMGEVLTEPAQKASTDKILDENLGSKVVDQAGAKIASASARVLLQKVAAAGCTCGGDEGDCHFCKLAAKIERRKPGRMGKQGQIGSAEPMPVAPPPNAAGDTASAAPQPAPGATSPWGS